MKFDNYSLDARNALNLAGEAAQELNHGFVGTEHILLGLIRGKGAAGTALSECGVTEKMVLPYIDTLIGGGRHRFTDSFGYTTAAKRVLELALYEAKSRASSIIDTGCILLAMMREADCFGANVLSLVGADGMLIKLALSKDNAQDMLVDESLSTETIDENNKKTPVFVFNNRDNQPYCAETTENNDRKRNTPVLDEYAVDLTALARQGRFDPLIGCKNELNRVIQTLLRRNKNNPVLVGSPGVGKSAIVEGLATLMVDGEVPKELKHTKLLRLEIASLVAGTKYRGEFEERLRAIIDELSDDVIIFIDEIHTIVGAGAGEGSVDAANIMKPALARGGMRIIGATTLDEYRRYIEKDAALERRFSPIIVKEPSRDEAIMILSGIKPRYERHHDVQICDDAVAACVDMSIRCMPERFLPDKAIDLMDEAASFAKLKRFLPERVSADSGTKEIEEALEAKNYELAAILREKKRSEIPACGSISVTRDDVAQVVQELTGIPISGIDRPISMKLATIAERLNKRVIGQPNAVEAIARAVRKGYAGLTGNANPLCSIILAGPSGSGKTELACALADELFPGEDALLRFDMDEYSEASGINALIGSPYGYKDSQEGGRLTEAVRRKPYSVLLLDNMQRAHGEVSSAVVRILDSGELADARGRKVSFRNIILLIAVNTDSVEQTRKSGFGTAADGGLKPLSMLKKLISPEIVNRVDCRVSFTGLSNESLRRICTNMLNTIGLQLAEKSIDICFDDSIVDYVFSGITDEELRLDGARAVKRRISTALEDSISEALLSGAISQGNRAICRYVDGELHISLSNCTNSPTSQALMSLNSC